MNILITGASGGLGTCLTATALMRGHRVFATVRSAEHIPERLEQFKKEYGDRLHVLCMDVSRDDSVKKAADYVRVHSESLDAIVNNAGIMTEREKTIETLDLSAMIPSFEVNTIGPMRVVQTFLSFLYRGEKPVIVNVSSEAGTIINAFETNYPYSMSKTALNMFSERLREYLRPKDILVYAVHPGWMRTNMGGVDAPANPQDIADGIQDILERKKKIYSKIAFIDATGRPMPL